MNSLNLEQMEKVQGGGFWASLGCTVLGIAVGTVATPIAGIAADTACEVLIPEKAY